MPDESDKAGTITDAAKAIAAITENVPIYQDAVQPAAKEIGKGLHLVAKAVNAALIPVEGFIWGMEQVRDFVHTKVAKKLENVPPEDIKQPKPHVGVPTLDALRYTGSEEELADLYANLLATSMDRKTAYSAHPAFVDIIKSMSPDEARIMKFVGANGTGPQAMINIKLVKQDSSFLLVHRHISLIGVDAQCEHPPITSNYIDNLERLGLLKVDSTAKITAEEPYKRIEDRTEISKIIEDLSKTPELTVEVQKIMVNMTDLGKQFYKVCVVDKEIRIRG